MSTLQQLPVSLNLTTTRHNSSLSHKKELSISTHQSLLQWLKFLSRCQKNGFLLDRHLTMNIHVSIIARTCSFEQQRLPCISRFLNNATTAKHVCLQLRCLEDGNTLLCGSTHDVTSHLYRIQKYAARLILRLPMSSNITIHIKSLNWLPVKV